MLETHPKRAFCALAAAGLVAGVVLSGCSAGALGDLATGGPRAPVQEADPRIELSSADTTVPAEGGTLSVEVGNAGGGRLDWTASIDRAFARISGSSSGSGAATVSIAFDANDTEDERAVVLTVRSSNADNSPQTLRFTQEAGAAREIKASAADFTIDPNGGTIEIEVSPSADDLQWELVPVPWRWARVLGQDSGAGDGTVTLEVDANNSGETRSLTLTVRLTETPDAAVELHFSQEGADLPRLTAAASSFRVGGRGGTVTVALKIESGAAIDWTATVSAGESFAGIAGASSGTGDGTLTLEVDANGNAEQRAFELRISAAGASGAPLILRFVQEGSAPPVLSVATNDRTVPHTGGTARIDIRNAGGGQMNWVLSVGESWASVSGSAVGTNSGNPIVVLDENKGARRSLAVTVAAEGASGSPQTITITQAAAPERPLTAAKITANKYSVSRLGETVIITLDITGGEALNWEARLTNVGRTCVITTEKTRREDDETITETVEENRSRGDWVRLLGGNRGTGDGSVRVQVDENVAGVSPCPRIRWSFGVAIVFGDAEELNQTLYFSQEGTLADALSLWTPTRHVGGGGETIEAYVTTPGSALVSWLASLDMEWAHFTGAGVDINNTVSGTGTATLRIEVDANTTGKERKFNLSVTVTGADVPAQSIGFTQAPAEHTTGGGPHLPAPPANYSNPCQSGTQGFINLGGWLVRRNSYYSTQSEGRVWRYIEGAAGDARNSEAGNVLFACAGHVANGRGAYSEASSTARIFRRVITHTDTPAIPEAFSDLPADADKRIIMLDLRVPAVGDYTVAAGVRHPRPTYTWSRTNSDWFPHYTDNDSSNNLPKFLLVQPLGDWGYGDKTAWDAQLALWNPENPGENETVSDMTAWTAIARANGWRLPSIQERTSEGQSAIRNSDSALWIMVGGYTGLGASRAPHKNSAVCGAMKELCLFAPWGYSGNEGSEGDGNGTARAAAHTAALLDTFLLIWPDYDLLELRNLVFECAEDMGETGADNRWGHGILNASCLFTPNGDLKDPRTDQILSGGIHGPMAGVFGEAITGFDRTGRDFTYPVTAWRWRDNEALLAVTGAESAPEPFPGPNYAPGVSRATLLDSGPFQAQIAAAGDAVAAVSQWRSGGLWKLPGALTLRGGLIMQPEGAGSLTGERRFRAPATLSGAFSFAWQHSFNAKLSLHASGQYWMTLDSEPRSLWTGTQLSEARASASLAYRHSSVRLVLQAQYFGGLAGRLDVAERRIRLMPHQSTQLSLRWNISW